ncbi:helix-turn-helix domain-containing protein [Neorhizobium sp. LjRoot104]|uniref:helix-turn-helix domain-containing protein n=1 Tax=Neorhizobium sp. LjRoot104 TaxID=3342254 RepID=UPI003ECC3EF9
MSFLFELDPKDEAIADLVADVGKKLQRTVNLRGLTQNEIAQRLEVDRSRVNRCLSGFNNLTLKSLAELTWAMDSKIRFEIELNEEEQVQAADETRVNVVTLAEWQGASQQQSAVPDLAMLRKAFG